MTGAELTRNVLEMCSESEGTFHTPSQVKSHLQAAELFTGLSRSLSEKTTTLSLTSGTSLYTLHAETNFPDLVHILRISIAGTQLFPTTLSHVSATDPQWKASAGTPRRFFVIGATLLGFYPIANATLTATITYIALPPVIPDSNNPMIGREWSEALSSYAAAVLLAKEGKLQDATQSLDSFMAAIGLDRDPRFAPLESQGESSKPAIHQSAIAQRG